MIFRDLCSSRHSYKVDKYLLNEWIITRVFQGLACKPDCTLHSFTHSLTLHSPSAPLSHSPCCDTTAGARMLGGEIVIYANEHSDPRSGLKVVWEKWYGNLEAGVSNCGIITGLTFEGCLTQQRSYIPYFLLLSQFSIVTCLSYAEQLGWNLNVLHWAKEARHVRIGRPVPFV